MGITTEQKETPLNLSKESEKSGHTQILSHRSEDFARIIIIDENQSIKTSNHKFKVNFIKNVII